MKRFNTQPPEGGWAVSDEMFEQLKVSTHSRPKAAGCQFTLSEVFIADVSTHSRPKAAGKCAVLVFAFTRVSTHSRPKAAGIFVHVVRVFIRFVSTHSRPKAAGSPKSGMKNARPVSTHSRPKAAGYTHFKEKDGVKKFQHTAARRRLVAQNRNLSISDSFNTQPPEGGWLISLLQQLKEQRFNTQPPEGGWLPSWVI